MSVSEKRRDQPGENPGEHAGEHAGEQRREERRPASGNVQIRFADPRPLEVAGRLMDLSERGFRMAHSFPSLASGQVVEFSHIEATGHARVMWNRIVDDRVETGFLVIAAGK